MAREEVILDFRKCTSITSIYDEMRVKMEWQDWYGTNLDALWDILTGLPYRGDDFVILRKAHYDDFTVAVNKICNLFLEAQEEYKQITVSIRYSGTL